MPDASGERERPSRFPSSQTDVAEDLLFARIGWRLLPLLVVCYVVAVIDRINIAYAQLGMRQTLPFGDEAYALGAGLFFIGYLLFEVPSNLVMARIGFRKTIVRIMVGWGLSSAALALVTAPWHLYVLRFLLGVFEAGFFPGMILYLTYWYPVERRARAFTTLTMALVAAPLLGGPLSGAILKFGDGALGLHGWQWLFVVQGLPACLLGLLAFFTLTDTPAEARWLTGPEKAYLATRLAAVPTVAPERRSTFVTTLLRDPAVYLFVAASVSFSGAVYALIFWMPTLIGSWGVRNPFHIGLYTVLPSLSAIAGLIVIGLSSDACDDRRWHFAGAATIAAMGIIVLLLSGGQLIPSLAGLCIVWFGQAALLPLYTAIISAYVPREIAAGGIALLSCVGQLGSAGAPFAVTRANAAFGAPAAGFCVLAILFGCSALAIVVALRQSAR